MKRIRDNSIFLLTAVILAFVLQCRSPGKVVERPSFGKTTEFHREPAKFIPYFYVNNVNRGIDRPGDVGFFSKMGGGAGLLINQPLSWQWIGHKFLYYYMDVDFSPEYAGGVYPGDKAWSVSSYPGLLMRTYTPFWMKLHYGAGLNIRLANTQYDRWGIYAKMGVEFYNITSSVVFIGHPGQSNWEREFRFGYLYAPID
ncbi:MAG: hypothetical protein KDK41_02000 [Leptospiraceae bacterium]|nr:hypothetical protein [Leptospiraceae bacterium]